MPPTTSFFSAALRRWLDNGHSQTEMENGAGLNPGRVSKYLRGEKPRADAFSRMLAVVDAETRHDLIESYLMDSCPPEYRHEVTLMVGPGDGGLAEAQPRAGFTRKDKFSRALAWLEEQGRHNQEIVKLIVSMHEVMTGGLAGKRSTEE
jgi:transcriptional regulator with XRE-family HTH domain